MIQKKKMNGSSSRRTSTIKYRLKSSQRLLVVCESMFLNTLCVGKWQVMNWASAAAVVGTHQLSDPYHPSNLPRMDTRKSTRFAERREFALKFLEDLPKLPSHYCRF
jgi:hypothetical protein